MFVPATPSLVSARARLGQRWRQLRTWRRWRRLGVRGTAHEWARAERVRLKRFDGGWAADKLLRFAYGRWNAHDPSVCKIQRAFKTAEHALHGMVYDCEQNCAKLHATTTTDPL